jgi:putative PIN family toxin of toxin-antitoxin system
MRKIIIDTNVLVSALRSKRGASYKLISLLNYNVYEHAVSVPLVLEYEDVLLRDVLGMNLTESDIKQFIDIVVTLAHKVKVYFLWRPYLKDPKDDHVLELAVAAEAEVIITYNKKDFEGVKKDFGIEILTPCEYLKQMEVIK